MQAWTASRYGPPAEVLSLTEKQLPAPGPGEVRLRVDAAAMGLPDVLMCRGEYEFSPGFPFTPGQDLCGTVIEVGEGVALQAGQRVLGVSSFFNGQGSLAQECMSMEGMLYPMPDNMSAAEAAAFGIAYQTAWVALVERGRLRAGETVVVLGGAGGSGSAAIQLASVLGGRVIAVAGGEARRRSCLDLGASEAVDHREVDFAAAVNELTGGAGADIVFDPVGGEVFARAVGCLTNGGRLLAVGFAAGGWGSAPARELVLRNAAAVGVYVGAYTPEQRLSFHLRLCELHARGSIRALVHDVVPFAEVPAALEAVARSAVIGKVVTCPPAPIGGIGQSFP